MKDTETKIKKLVDQYSKEELARAYLRASRRAADAERKFEKARSENLLHRQFKDIFEGEEK